MKKITALILAGALCASMLPFAACGNSGAEGKIPQIPAGVNLSTVKEADMEKTYEEIWEKFTNSSDNAVYNVYTNNREDIKREDGESHYSDETSKKFKYFKDGEKVFADLKSDTGYSRDGNYNRDGQDYRDLYQFNAKYKGFVKNGKKGLVGETYFKTDYNGETNEGSSPETLAYFEEGFRLTAEGTYPAVYQVFAYNGDAGGLNLRYFADYVGDYLDYKTNDNYIPINSSEDACLAEIKVTEYKLDMRADETKLYMNLSRKVRYTYNDSQKATQDWNMQITFYLDVAANNTADTFNQEYVTAENTKETTYYAFDTVQAAKDIKDGKEVVINPSGGDATGINGFYSGQSPDPESIMRVVFYKNGETDYDMFSVIRSVPIQVKDGVITIPADTYDKIKTAVGEEKLSGYEIGLSFSNTFNYTTHTEYICANIYL